MRNRITGSLFILLLVSFGKVAGQGCSDPGICTSGSLNSANTQDSTSQIDFTEASMKELLNASIASEKHRIGADFVYGIGDKRTSIYTILLRYSIRIKEKVLVNVKMPFAFNQGNIGSSLGTGDLTITMQNTFKSGKNMNLAYTVGGVIPTNNANLKYQGETMPMVYQTTLGLFSLLGGLAVRYKEWSAVIGYQHSFGANGNEFVREDITVDSLDAQFKKQLNRKSYTASKGLMRGGDLIFRLERGFKIKNLNIALGVLPILRLSKSSVIDTTGERIEIEGSNGLTLNLTAGASYHINKSTFVKLNMGGPILKRKIAPDGLFRDSVLIVGFGVKMW